MNNTVQINYINFNKLELKHKFKNISYWKIVFQVSDFRIQTNFQTHDIIVLKTVVCMHNIKNKNENIIKAKLKKSDD